MKEQINLEETIRLFLFHWWKIVLTGVLCAVLAIVISVTAITPMYSSNGSVYINNSGIGDAEHNPLYANLTDIATAQQLAFTCAKILTSESFLTRVIEEADVPYTAKQLQGMVYMEPVDETEILAISVVSPSPADCQNIVNTIMDLATDEIHRVVGAGNIRVIDEGKYPAAPYSPNLVQNIFVGFVFGVILCAAYIFLRDFFDNRIKIEADLMKIKELPMLGSIPLIESAKKEEK